MLVDERFEAKANPRCSDSKKISRWVRDRLVIYKDYNKFKNELNSFVTKMTPKKEFEIEEMSNERKIDVKPIITII